MKNKRNISVCFTPSEFHHFINNDSIVVVVDLLRATTVISTAFEYGIKSVIPVQNLGNLDQYKDKEGYILAAERETKLVAGFDFGNSPYHYMNKEIRGKVLALTTTNGTKAIHAASAHELITASYINIKVVSEFLIQKERNVIILCSGWKNRFNLEDSLFAASLSNLLIRSKGFKSNCDSLHASQHLLKIANNDLFKFLENSAYRKRNLSDEVIRDTKFCLNPSIESDVVPIFSDGRLIRLNDL